MFLYWKKRGAYELETLPTDMVGLDYGMVERFSWNSATDMASDLDGRSGSLHTEGLRDEVSSPGGCVCPLCFPQPPQNYANILSADNLFPHREAAFLSFFFLLSFQTLPEFVL